VEGAGFARSAWVRAAALYFSSLAGKSPRVIVEARIADLDAERRDDHQRAALGGEVVLKDIIGDDEVAATHHGDGATLSKGTLIPKPFYMVL
jgi:hypothetical protein